MRDYEELLGADYVEHNVHRHGLGLTRAVSVIGEQHEDILRGHVPVGKNKVGDLVLVSSWSHQIVTGTHGLPRDDLCRPPDHAEESSQQGRGRDRCSESLECRGSGGASDEDDETELDNIR